MAKNKIPLNSGIFLIRNKIKSFDNSKYNLKYFFVNKQDIFLQIS